MNTQYLKEILDKIPNILTLNLESDMLSQMTTINALSQNDIAELAKIDFFQDIVTDYKQDYKQGTQDYKDIVATLKRDEADEYHKMQDDILHDSSRKNRKDWELSPKKYAANRAHEMKRTLFDLASKVGYHADKTSDEFAAFADEVNGNRSKFKKLLTHKTHQTVLPEAPVYANLVINGDEQHLSVFATTSNGIIGEAENAHNISSNKRISTMAALPSESPFLPKQSLLAQTINHTTIVTKVIDGLTMAEAFSILKLADLARMMDNELPSNDVATALTELLFLQTKSEIENSQVENDKSEPEKEEKDEPEHVKNAELSADVKHFLSTFNPSFSGMNSIQGRFVTPTLTLRQFKQFLIDIKENNPIDPAVISWLMGTRWEYNEDETGMSKDDESIINTLLKSMNLNDIMERVSVDEISDIVDDLNKDHGFAEHGKIMDVYKINSKNKHAEYLDKRPNAVQHKILTHGTSNGSVLTILRDGLLRRDEFSKDARADLTGLGLGDGVYFARTDQAGKSISYSSYNTPVRYLFIADVIYSEVLDVNHYGDYGHNGDWDLLHAHRVGSYDRDELVARYSNQIEIKYMIAIK